MILLQSFSQLLQASSHRGALFREVNWCLLRFAEQGATCSPLDHNAGEARRRDRVCFPDGFSKKAVLCIDVCVLVSTV